MLAIGEIGEGIRIQRTGCRKGIAFDTRNLYQPANRVASQSQVMLQPHLGRILDLCRRPPEQLAGRSSCHRTSHTDLSLASYLGPGNGCIRTDHITEQPGCRQRTQDTGVTEVAGLFQMVKHSRHDTARTAGRGRHDLASASVLLGNGQSIRIDHPTAFDTAAVTFGTDHIVGCLTPDSQTAGQDAFGFEAVTDRLLHHFPYFGQIVPYLRTFALFDIFPVGMAGFFTPGLYVLDSMHFVDLTLCQLVVGFVCQRPSPDTVNRPVIQFLSAFVKRLEEDAVRMKRQEHLRFPSDIGLGHRAQHFENCRIRHVAFSCSRQAPIERNIKTYGSPIAFQEHPGSTHRPHCVATGRPVTDPVYLLDRFHCFEIYELSFVIYDL